MEEKVEGESLLQRESSFFRNTVKMIRGSKQMKTLDNSYWPLKFYDIVYTQISMAQNSDKESSLFLWWRDGEVTVSHRSV